MDARGKLDGFVPSRRHFRGCGRQSFKNGVHFRRKASLGLDSDALLFNADHNVLCFRPRRVGGDGCIPSVIFKALGVSGRRIVPNMSNDLLQRSLSGARRLMLSRGRGVMALSFTTLSVVCPRGVHCTCHLHKFSGR